MARFDSPLNNVRVAAPCSADWNQMIGTERVRFCAQCSLNVYNLSSMKRSEAEALISSTEGRLCVRYYRRSDGTVLTDNCPVGLRAIKRRLSRVVTAALSVFMGFMAGLNVYVGVTEEEMSSNSNTMGTIAVPVDREVKPKVETVTMGTYAPLEPVVGRYVRPKPGAKLKRVKSDGR